MNKRKARELFLIAYLECLLFTEESVLEREEEISLTDLDETCKKQLMEEAGHFFDENEEMIRDNPARAGHDFWLTRNRHGAGFWDGHWPNVIGQKLTEASHSYGSVDCYQGDDGKIYTN